MMRHIKRYSELFESEGKLTKEQTEFLDRYTDGTWSVNPTTGLVDVDGDFDCSVRGLSTLGGIKFGSVTGGFYCRENKLTSLEGAPKEVGVDFNCSENELTSLEGAPKEISGDFYCNSNDLTSLEGAPKEVVGDFNCYDNELTSLKGAPKEVVGGFYCSSNDLTSLEGAPKEVGGNFNCSANKLTSLEGAPERVGGDFYLKSYYEHFKWTPKGKIGFIGEHPEYGELIIPTLPYEDLLKIVSEDSSLLGTIEEADKILYDKVLKGLGWDKMGPDLLRQLKQGLI